MVTGALRSRYKIMSERVHARYGQSGRLPRYVYDSFHQLRTRGRGARHRVPQLLAITTGVIKYGTAGFGAEPECLAVGDHGGHRGASWHLLINWLNKPLVGTPTAIQKSQERGSDAALLYRN
jgi:hypothetical protein